MEFKDNNFILDATDQRILHMPGREQIPASEAGMLIDAASLARDAIAAVNIADVPDRLRAQVWADHARDSSTLSAIARVLAEHMPVMVTDEDINLVLGFED
jgi:uncharacterized protein YcbX